jgi:hypothetical protein
LWSAIALQFVLRLSPLVALPGASSAQASCLGNVGYASAAEDTAPPRPAIHLAYVYDPGCAQCQRVEYALKHLQRMYPQLAVQRYSVADPKDAPIVEALAELYGLPSKQRLVAPAVFLGDQALVGEEVKERVIRELVRKYEDAGAPPRWESFRTDSGAQRIHERLESFSLIAVLAAGLLDGINPCAFTTLVFLVSYLALVGRKGRDIILVGICFTGSVFVTYLLIGVGALKFIQSVSFVPVLSVVVYGLAAFLAFLFAALSLYDYFKFRSGRPGESILQLPNVLKLQIHKVIRTKMRSSSIIVSTLVAGFLVSVLELACTGQVYLPTILFVTRTQGLGSPAFLYLLLYNLMFVVPLVVVFVAAYEGMTSQKIGELARRHLGAVKLATSVLFFGLGLALLTSLLL